MSDLYKIIPAKEFRKTRDVVFHYLSVLDNLKGLDLVRHAPNALSPGPVGEIENPWYMHPHQTDNLIVFTGKRIVQLYTKDHGKIETFYVTPDKIEKDGEVLHEGPAILSWPTNVFHRVHSGEEGSYSLNLAVRDPGFDVNTEFNIYDVNTETGEYKIIREGKLDQKGVN